MASNPSEAMPVNTKGSRPATVVSPRKYIPAAAVYAGEPSGEVSVQDGGSQVAPATFECIRGHKVSCGHEGAGIDLHQRAVLCAEELPHSVHDLPGLLSAL